MGIGQTIKNAFKEGTPPHTPGMEDHLTSDAHNAEGNLRGPTTGTTTGTSPTTDFRHSTGYGAGTTPGATAGAHESGPGVASRLPPGSGPGTTGKPSTDTEYTRAGIRGYDTTGPLSSEAERNRGYYGEDRTSGAHPGTGTGPIGASALGAGAAGARTHRPMHEVERRLSTGSASSDEVTGRRRRASDIAPRTGAAVDGVGGTRHIVEPTSTTTGTDVTRNVLDVHDVGHPKLSAGESMPTGDTIQDSTQLAPVTHESIREVEYEEVERRKENERHIHHIQHHIQPIVLTESLPETYSEKRHPLTRIHERHANEPEQTDVFEGQVRQYRDSSVLVDKEKVVIDKGIVVNEHIHHHLHHVIQPVVQKQVIKGHRVHTIIPSHQITHEAPLIHETETHAPISMERFIGDGGKTEGAFSQREASQRLLHAGSCIREVNGIGERLARDMRLDEKAIVDRTVERDISTSGARSGGVSGSQSTSRHYGPSGAIAESHSGRQGDVGHGTHQHHTVGVGR